MSWFKKTMALPFYLQRADEGAWVISDKMRQETAEQQKTKHNPSFLGSGINGLAINLGTNAGKYTSFKEEAAIANYLKNNPSECFVRVFDVQEIQKKPSIFLIEMEKCSLFTDKDRTVLNAMYTKIKETGLNEENIIKAYNKIKFYPYFYKVLYPHFYKILTDYKNFLLCLFYSGFKTEEYNPTNIGYNPKGTLVLFDLGFLNYKKTNL